MKVIAVHPMSVITAAFVAATCVSATLSIQPACSQLPATTWGKSVHKPGDNQYGGQQQNMRHPPKPPPQVRMPAGVRGGGGGGGGGPSASWRPTRKPPKPDVSLQPIPADEPVAPTGFPPLPDRLDLPGVSSTTALSFNAATGRGGGGGGAGPRSAGSNPYQGKKQGYAHFKPGAFSDKKRAMPSSMSGGGESMPVPVGDRSVELFNGYGHVSPGGHRKERSSPGYYKARSPQKPGDTFGAGEPGAGGAPAYTGMNPKALKKLGREPKLDDRTYGGENPAPDAPTPVQINQATSQDLSLPDDDFEYRRPGSKFGRFMKRKGKQAVTRGRGFVRRVVPMGGIGNF